MKTAKIALGLIAACAACCAAPLFAALTLGLGGFGSLLSGQMLPALIAAAAVSLALLALAWRKARKGATAQCGCGTKACEIPCRGGEG